MTKTHRGIWFYIGWSMLLLQCVTAAVSIVLALNMKPDRVLPNAYSGVGMDTVAIVVMTMMFFSVLRSGNLDRSTRNFGLIVFCCNGYLFLDILHDLLESYGGFPVLHYVISLLFFAGGIVLMWMFWQFLQSCFGTGGRGVRIADLIVDITAAIGLLMIIGNVFFDYYFTIDASGRYVRAPTYPISLISSIVLTLACSVRIIRAPVSLLEKLTLLSHPLLPVFGALVTALRPNTSLLAVEVFASLFFIYSNIFVRRDQELAGKKNELRQKQSELKEARVNLMISQMQPHFVSNTLGMIRHLYRRSPGAAENAMNAFISYLQMNFSELNSQTPIPAAREVEHIRLFTQLEQLRWPDMAVEFDIQTTDFRLPAMTLQPLVENAIRHGLMPLKTGGVVRISMRENEESYVAIVADNGVGFDPEHPEPKKPDHRAHIGLPNIRDRLQAMCGGSLEIDSTIGRGTVATVRIPKEERK